MEKPLAEVRREYAGSALTRASADSDPIRQFRHWFGEALRSEIPDPNAMTLATATPDGKPSARIVLLKEFDERGFVFYTNYDSRKGVELAQNPRAALVFYWPELNRQVRIEGTVSRVSREESIDYFNQRPRESRLAALVSQQSEVLPDRHLLEEKMEELSRRYGENDIPTPENWGGYRVQADSIEFWQGRPSRLHDRLLYTRRPDGSWEIQRLAP